MSRVRWRSCSKSRLPTWSRPSGKKSTSFPDGIGSKSRHAYLRSVHPLLSVADSRNPADVRVYLERPTVRREQDYLQGVKRSRLLHRGFVSTPSTSDEYRDYLRRSRRKNQKSFFVSLVGSGDLVGVINVNEIVRYSFKSAYLGYYAFAPHAGAGLMQEGLRLVLGRCFGDLKLHRLEANIQPANKRSRALVRSLGFRKEGLSRRYLKICGRWRDHERWAILAEDWRRLRRVGGAAGRTHATPFRA